MLAVSKFTHFCFFMFRPSSSYGVGSSLSSSGARLRHSYHPGDENTLRKELINQLPSKQLGKSTKSLWSWYLEWFLSGHFASSSEVYVSSADVRQSSMDLPHWNIDLSSTHTEHLLTIIVYTYTAEPSIFQSATSKRPKTTEMTVLVSSEAKVCR